MTANIRVYGQRIVALEIRKSCIGYAVFQGPTQLLDYGTTSPAPLSNATERVRNKLHSILKLLTPATIVVCKPHGRASRGTILRVIRIQAEQHSVPVMVIRKEHIGEALGMFRAGNKDARAERLTQIFPELLFKLPRKRRAWQSEPHSMLVFDATAAGLAFWTRPDDDRPEAP